MLQNRNFECANWNIFYSPFDASNPSAFATINNIDIFTNVNSLQKICNKQITIIEDSIDYLRIKCQGVEFMLYKCTLAELIIHKELKGKFFVNSLKYPPNINLKCFYVVDIPTLFANRNENSSIANQPFIRVLTSDEISELAFSYIGITLPSKPNFLENSLPANDYIYAVIKTNAPYKTFYQLQLVSGRNNYSLPHIKSTYCRWPDCFSLSCNYVKAEIPRSSSKMKEKIKKVPISLSKQIVQQTDNPFGLAISNLPIYKSKNICKLAKKSTYSHYCNLHQNIANHILVSKEVDLISLYFYFY